MHDGNSENRAALRICSHEDGGESRNTVTLLADVAAEVEAWSGRQPSKKQSLSDAVAQLLMLALDRENAPDMEGLKYPY